MRKTITIRGKKRELDVIILTPQMAVKLLEANTINRPLRQWHIDEIAAEISGGEWKFNGATIKIRKDGGVFDGQHRLWGCVLADVPIETVIVYGIEEDAFSTIDTMRISRSGADVLALAGLTRHCRDTATALGWLIRWQNDTITTRTSKKNAVRNRDIERCYQSHKDMAQAVSHCSRTKGLISPGVSGFLYYIFSEQDQELADRFLATLVDPIDTPLDDPFFRFRAWLLKSLEKRRRREATEMIALAFKAWNYARDGKKISVLSWRNHGPTAEEFPTISKIALRDLDINNPHKTVKRQRSKTVHVALSAAPA